jgi:IPT/TIG domain
MKSIKMILRKTTSITQPERDGMTVRTEPRVRDEAGATLILALLFMVVIGLIVGGLATWTSNSLTDTVAFAQVRSSQFALSSASQVAIQSIRYTPLLGTSPPAAPSPQTLNASPPTYCWGTSADSYGGTELTTQNDAVEVYCSTVWNPTSAATRVVTVSACLQSLLPAPGSTPSPAAACAQTPGLQTTVTFDDYSSSAPTVNPGPCVSTCGTGMTINSSVSRSGPPTVTGLSSTQGPVYPANGSTLTVTGTGFVSGSTTVNFVASTASLNLSIPGSGVSVASPTSLTVVIPAATTVTSYYVIVSTPSGSSSAGSGAEYTYQPVIPTVSSISIASGGTPTGSAAGGTSITITGTGFLNNFAGDKTAVNFVDTQNASNVIPALNLTVNSSTSITATTPSVASTDLTYYVVVTTQPTGLPSADGPVFTYQLFNPVVASVSPTSGGGASQSLTLTGIGFITGGTTVSFVPVANGNTPTASTPVVSSSTALTVTVSGGTKGKVYYVEVTTSGGNSGTGGAANEYTY